jgi:CRISPR-associated protein Cas1
MACLCITEPYAVLRKTGDRVIVEKDGETIMEVPCLKLDTVLLYGKIQFTYDAAVELLQHGIELSLFSSTGHLWGQLTPPKARNMVLRMRQYELVHSEAFCLRLAKSIIRGKITNAVAVLRRFHINHPQAVPLAVVSDLESRLGRIDATADLDTLRGLEGSAAAAYFGTFAAMVPEDLGFTGRQRRPPRDPVNSLLSFGYVLVGNELQSLLDGMGFDPYIGFFHALDYGRASLAFDLLEEFRHALVDRLTTSLLNRGVLKKKDFQATPDGGLYLDSDGKRRYFTEYTKELTTPFSVDGRDVTFRDLFRRQADRLAAAITRDEPYESFRLPC